MAEERKVVTVLFADCVGSTPIGERLDPEDLAEVMHAFFDEMRAAVEAEGGVVEKFIGDAVMALFGVPSSHEDDPSRALRCALAMFERLDRLNDRLESVYGTRFGLRIGVNTGEVLASTEPGADLGQITGDAINVAARLEQTAEPGQVVVSERTARAAPGFRFEELGPLALKGKSAPFRAFRVLEATPLAGPGAAPRGVAGLQAPMVGRDHELAVLGAAYERSAREQRPHLVTVYGEAGVGKSRLVREFVGWSERLAERPLVVRGRCLPYGDGVTYWPLAEILKSLGGILDSDAGRDALAKLDTLATSLGDALAPEDVGALAMTAGFEGADIALAAASPKQRRTAIHAAWRTLLSCLARTRPVIAIVEDIHWADEALLDLLEDVADRGDGAIVVVCPSRPDLTARRPTWGGGRRNASSVSLEPLSLDDARRLTALLLDVDDLTEPVRARILERAEGNPFFLEEILRKLIDEGRIVRDGARWRATAGAAEVTIPDSVQSVLSARIDLLPAPAKRVLQRAAVVGRVFWTGSIGDVATTVPDELDDVLDVLEARDLISTRIGSAFRGERECAFRHILTRNVAYDSIPRRERGGLHAEVGDWLADVASGREGEFAELLAHHWSQAHAGAATDGRADPAEVERRRAFAYRWNLAAARESFRRAVLPRAQSFADHALALSSGPDERADAAWLLADAYIAAGSGDRALRAYRLAADTLIEAGAPDRQRAALACAMVAQLPARFSGSLHEAFDETELYAYVDRGLELAGTEDSEALARLCAVLSFWSRPGTDSTDPAVARAHRADAERALAMARRLDLSDVESAARDALGSDLSSTGALQAAATNSLERLELMDRLGDQMERGDALCMAAWTQFDIGSYEAALEHARRVELEVEASDWSVLAHGRAWMSLCNAVLGRWDAVLDDMAAGARGLVQAGLDAPPPYVTPIWGSAAFVLESRGQAGEAADAADVALDRGRLRDASPVRTPMAVLWLVRRGELDAAQRALPGAEEMINRPTRILAVLADLDLGRARGDWATRRRSIEQRLVTRDGEPAPHRACRAELAGWLARSEGDARRAVDAFAESAALWRSTGAVWPAARVALIAAEVAHETGEARAGALASLAVAPFEAMGAVAEAARARSLAF